MKLTKMTKRPSYTERLMSLPLGEEHFFTLNGTAYQQFQNAKHRLKKSGRATFEMNVVVGEKKLRVVRLTQRDYEAHSQQPPRNAQEGVTYTNKDSSTTERSRGKRSATSEATATLPRQELDHSKRSKAA